VTTYIPYRLTEAAICLLYIDQRLEVNADKTASHNDKFVSFLSLQEKIKRKRKEGKKEGRKKATQQNVQKRLSVPTVWNKV
jgi:cell fate (sporulation/competence/biofilm development) regulator YlbF (YheA/YmcA/DUF963 family)